MEILFSSNQSLSSSNEASSSLTPMVKSEIYLSQINGLATELKQYADGSSKTTTFYLSSKYNQRKTLFLRSEYE